MLIFRAALPRLNSGQGNISGTSSWSRGIAPTKYCRSATTICRGRAASTCHRLRLMVMLFFFNNRKKQGQFCLKLSQNL